MGFFSPAIAGYGFFDFQRGVFEEGGCRPGDGDQNGASNGFAELSKYDGNRDGRIDSKDSIFKALQLYRDLNGNGRVDAGEMKSLAQSDIVSLNLRFLRETAKLNGNSLLLRGSFERADGSTGRMDDVLFGFRDAK